VSQICRAISCPKKALIGVDTSDKAFQRQKNNINIMFQRQTRSSFSAGTIMLAAAAAVALVYFALKYTNSTPPAAKEPTTNSGLRPSEAWEAAHEYPYFRPDLAMYQYAMQMANEQVVERGFGGPFDAVWTVQGPNNIGARVNTLKVHPTNPDIIYAGYSGGGVWKTTDGGETWNPIFDQRTSLSIGDIELDPNNPEIVYVGTGDPNIGLNAAIGDGLWKSTNGGQTWQSLGLATQAIVTKIIVQPNGTLYVATAGLPFERNNNRGVYKSTNGGQTWTQSLFIDNQTGVAGLVEDPTNPNVLYAASWTRIRTNQESTLASNQCGIWKTTNGGQNWTRLGGGLPDFRTGRAGIDIDATNPNRLAVTFADTSSSFQNIYLTTDGGLTWTNPANNNLDFGFQGGFAWYFGKVKINPFDPQDIWMCGVEMWRSLDGGENWFQTTPDWWTYEVHADMHDIKFVDASTVIIATDGGIYRSEDAGTLWTKIENIPTTQLYRVAYNPTEPEWYYGGAQDNGTFGGNASFANDWPRLWGGDGFQAVFHPTDPNIFYFETQNGNISGTVNGFTQDFFDGNLGMDENDRRFWDMPYFMSKHDPNFMYTGTYRAYASFGHPVMWTPISEDLTDGVIFGNSFHTISAIDESPLVAQRLYVGTTDGNVWRGDDAAVWTNITAGLPDRFVSSVRPSPTFPDRVYVSHTGYRDNVFTALMHRSDDKGQTWQPISGNMPPVAVHDLYIVPNTQDKVICAATDGGVFATRDGGLSWTRLANGMPSVRTLHLTRNDAQNTLVAGTFSRSIMTYPLDTLTQGLTSTKPAPSIQYGLKAWPNLIRAGQPVQIELPGLPISQQANIQIVALNGSSIWQETRRGIEVGSMTYNFANCAPGTYIVVARVQNRVVGTQKVVVARR
jgi:photosystem II stability/assembly factor-like uncharacterized protein